MVETHGTMRGSPCLQGWLEKYSVSAPRWRKNWRSRLLVLWDDRICWHKGSLAWATDAAAGELRLEPETKVLRDGPTLSIACADRVLVLRGSAQQVRARSPRAWPVRLTPCSVCRQIDEWEQAVHSVLAPLAQAAEMTPLQAPAAADPIQDAAAEAQAETIVKGTSAEVKEAAKAEAEKGGEDWAQLSWQRRQKLCASAAATVLQAKIDAGPQRTQTLCRNLRALEPVAAAATTSASSPPFPKLGLGRKEVLGAHHPNTLTSIGNMVDLLREMGRLAEAEVVLGNAVAVARETLGDDHLITLVLTAKAARLQHAQPGGAAAGKELLAATVARMAEVLGEGHQQTSKYREALREME